MKIEYRPLTENQKSFVRAMVRQALDARAREQAHKSASWETMANYNEGTRIGILFTIRAFVNRARSPFTTI